jgi:hypothetical protein
MSRPMVRVELHEFQLFIQAKAKMTSIYMKASFWKKLDKKGCFQLMLNEDKEHDLLEPEYNDQVQES